MIKVKETKLNKMKPSLSEISVVFEDSNVHQEQFTFLKDRLNKYKDYINDEYTMESESAYDESLKLLSIDMIIRIPDHLMPTDHGASMDIIMDTIKFFQIFYDAQNEIFKRNIQNSSY